MKPWQKYTLAAVAVALYLWFRKSARQAADAAKASAQQAAAVETLAEVNDLQSQTWGNPGEGPTTALTPADQNLYPGFYVTDDGGYVNPDNGQAYSPGTSPVVFPEPKSIGLNLSGLLRGFNPRTVANPTTTYTEGQVIY